MAGDDASPPPPPPSEIKPNSPYYLGSQDRPGDFITPTRLNSDNYDTWAADIQTALEARRKFGFLDGTILVPSPPCTSSDWTAINAMLISWISNTIDPEIRSSLSKFREAKSFWDHLKQRFAQTNGPRIQQLKSSISKCEQTKTMPVSVYYGKLHSLWQELDHHEPLISCKITGCTCGRLHEERRAQAKLHDFLMGLYPDFYAALRTQILSQDPLPTLDRAYQLVSQDERVRSSRQEVDQKSSEALGFAVRSDAGKGRGQSERPYCTKCKRLGHDASTCWADITCIHCKKRGHESSRCYEVVGYPEGWFDGKKSVGRGRGQVRANATSGNNTSTVSAFGQMFTPEQWKAISGIIGNTKVPDNRLNGPNEGADWNGS